MRGCVVNCKGYERRGELLRGLARAPPAALADPQHPIIFFFSGGKRLRRWRAAYRRSRMGGQYSRREDCNNLEIMSGTDDRLASSALADEIVRETGFLQPGRKRGGLVSSSRRRGSRSDCVSEHVSAPSRGSRDGRRGFPDAHRGCLPRRARLGPPGSFDARPLRDDLALDDLGASASHAPERSHRPCSPAGAIDVARRQFRRRSSRRPGHLELTAGADIGLQHATIDDTRRCYCLSGSSAMSTREPRKSRWCAYGTRSVGR